MVDYVTVKDTSDETEIKRSRFIAFALHVEDGDDAVKKLNGLRKKYYDSTHVCYAYCADETGNEIRFSDDGEPSGTAGQPILEALKKSGLKKTLVAVVRYFGGILLGAGGLVRAYSSSASAVLAKAEKVTYSFRDFYRAEFGFSVYKKIEKQLALVASVKEVGYTDRVTVILAVAPSFDLKGALDNLCACDTAPQFLGGRYDGGSK